MSASSSGPRPSLAEAPLALVGYSAAAAEAFREAGLLALSLPDAEPAEVVSACSTLGFVGALIAQAQGGKWLSATQPDPEAVRAGRVDAVAFAGKLSTLGVKAAQGSFTLAEALAEAVVASGFTPHGAALLVLGEEAADMTLAAPLIRLGFSDIGLVAQSAPEAERARKLLPSAPRLFPTSRRDTGVGALADRSDLIVLTAGELPRGLLQPYHLLLDLTGKVRPQQCEAHLLTLEDLGAYHLSRRLRHATGQHYAPEDLHALAQLLG